MKTASAKLKTLLASDNFTTADLYEITLADGTALRYTTADIDLVVGGRHFRSAASLFERSKVSWKLGLEVDTLDLTVYPSPDDLIGGLSFIQALQAGALDGAEVMVERVFMPSTDPSDTSAGSVILFAGHTGEIDDAGPSMIPVPVYSHLERLNKNMPRNTYQPSCLHVLFDSGCGLNRASYRTIAVVGSGATPSSVPVTGTGQADNYFDQGVAVWAGQKRTVKKWSGNVLTLVVPFAAAPGANDPIHLYPGCNKTMVACDEKFNNFPNFRGQPFVPVPETSV